MPKAFQTIGFLTPNRWFIDGASRIRDGLFPLPSLMVLILSGLLFLALAFSCGCTGTTTDTGSVDSGARTVTDMRGRAVELPATIERVVAIDDGFVEGLLYRFGMQDRVVGLGGAWIKDYTYTFETTDGTTYEYKNS
mgnify:CR=1 FL=1